MFTYSYFAPEVREFWYPRFQITCNFDGEKSDIMAWCADYLPPDALDNVIRTSDTTYRLTFKTRQDAMLFKLYHNGNFNCTGVRSTIQIQRLVMINSTNYGSYQGQPVTVSISTTPHYVILLNNNSW